MDIPFLVFLLCLGVVVDAVMRHGLGDAMARIVPDLTYPGSLANLLWRNIVHRDGMPARFTEFTRVGLCTTPLCLLAAVGGLRAGVELLGP